MNHLTDDQLLLHAFGESADAAAAEHHLESCAGCRERFRVLEESRAGLEWGSEPRRAVSRRALRVALPLAAAIATLLLVRLVRQPATQRTAWQPHLSASPTAGYVTGTTFMRIDSQLTRLEKGTTYDLLQD